MFFWLTKNKNISRLKVLRDPGFDGLQRIIQVFAQFQLQLIHTFFQVQRPPHRIPSVHGRLLGGHVWVWSQEMVVKVEVKSSCTRIDQNMWCHCFQMFLPIPFV